MTPCQRPKGQNTRVFEPPFQKHRILRQKNPPIPFGPTPGEGPKGPTGQREPWADALQTELI